MRYFEDFQVGDTFDCGPAVVTEEALLRFAREFDPQPFHLDAVAAKDSIFGELIASGLYTASFGLRLLVDGLPSLRSEGSPGWDELRWLKPVKPGDALTVRWACIEARPLGSRPTIGLLRAAVEMRNQHDEPVMTFVQNWFVGRRPAAGA